MPHAIRHWTVIVYLCYRLTTIARSSTIDTRRWVIIPKHKANIYAPHPSAPLRMHSMHALRCLSTGRGKTHRTADPAAFLADVMLRGCWMYVWTDVRRLFRCGARGTKRNYIVLQFCALIQWTMTRFCCWERYDDITTTVMLLCNYQIWQCRSALLAFSRGGFLSADKSGRLRCRFAIENTYFIYWSIVVVVEYWWYSRYIQDEIYRATHSEREIGRFMCVKIERNWFLVLVRCYLLPNTLNEDGGWWHNIVSLSDLWKFRITRAI